MPRAMDQPVSLVAPPRDLPHRVLVHGVRIASDVLFPPWEGEQVGAGDAAVAAAELWVQRGRVPERLEGAQQPQGLWQVAGDTAMLELEGVGRVLVAGGTGATYDLAPGADERDLAAFLWGSVLPVLLAQRGVVTLRGTALADEHGALLILDEVQTGIGRTGAWFAHQAEGVRPDVITLAKGLGGGLPIGACIGIGKAAELFTPGSHGSTFGGNPVSCAAALAVLDVIEHEGLLARAAVLHDVLGTRLLDASEGVFRAYRGRGLLMAMLTTELPASEFERIARSHGLLVNGIAPDAIRLAPALTLSDADVDDAVSRWAAACAQVTAGDAR